MFPPLSFITTPNALTTFQNFGATHTSSPEPACALKWSNPAALHSTVLQLGMFGPWESECKVASPTSAQPHLLAPTRILPLSPLEFLVHTDDWNGMTKVLLALVKKPSHREVASKWWAFAGFSVLALKVQTLFLKAGRVDPLVCRTRQRSACHWHFWVR